MVSSSCAPTTTRIGFTRDTNPGLQGESGMCDPPLNPDLHPFGTLWPCKLRRTVSLMAWYWRRRIYMVGRLKARASEADAERGLFSHWVTHRVMCQNSRVWHPQTETVCHVQKDACWFKRDDIIRHENMIWSISFCCCSGLITCWHLLSLLRSGGLSVRAHPLHTSEFLFPSVLTQFVSASKCETLSLDS